MALLNDRRFILASASPRRLDLLRQVGVEPLLLPVDIPEQACPAPGQSPAELVCANARAKARAAWQQVGAKPVLILGADTVVQAADGRLLGKPRNGAEAAAMLRLLSGGDHSVLTGQCLLDAASGRELCQAAETRVSFLPLAEAEIQAYVSGGEPLDKAGAYGMQGQAGLFVRSIHGDYSTVVGLSLPLLYQMYRLMLSDENQAPRQENVGRDRNTNS